MTTDTLGAGPAERIRADRTTVRHLGHWTEATRFEVRARSAAVVLDLRSPRIPGGGAVEVRLDLTRAVVRLLLPEDAELDLRDLARNGRGRVKDSAPGAGGRVVRLVGAVSDGEVRIHRGGVAVLSAMCSRAYLADLRRAHREGGLPTVDDPARPSSAEGNR